MDMLQNKIKSLLDLLCNILWGWKYDLFYIVENKNWSINWDGKYITQELNRQKLLKARISSVHWGLRNKLIHFGSANALITNQGIRKTHPSNTIIATWFHIPPNDEKIRFIPELNKKSAIVHTSCGKTKQQLIKFGLNSKKIVIVPLGVDLQIFKAYENNKRKHIKETLKLPEDKIIIGSFQKDGDGWKGGLSPKLVKGPDIFCSVVEDLSRKYPIHILLTGPARGYVKERLKKANISYTHAYLENYLDIVDYYNALDLYIITSREEGGPKALLECMACGIPVVSTEVGMVTDIVENKKEILISPQEDINDLVRKSALIIESPDLRKKLIENSLETIKHYTWEKAAERYYNKIYKSLLK